VLCSADQSDALQARADALGVQLLRKPVDEATLLAALQQSAGRHASTLGEEHG
jgi:CheY-like chemotaxis protein